MSWPRRTSPPGLGELATLVHRLAVLLAAGVSSAEAWRLAADGAFDLVVAEVRAAVARAGPDAIPDALAAAARAGQSGGYAIRAAAERRTPSTAAGADQMRSTRARLDVVRPSRPASARVRAAERGPAARGVRSALRDAWSGLAASWAVSSWTGAPLAPVLRAYAELLRGFAGAEHDTRVALAGPRATSRLVLVLPLVAVAFGALLGQDTLGVLFGTPLGWICLAVGVGLGVAGWAWTRGLLAKASSAPPLPGIAEELTAVAMSGGVSVARARELVSTALDRHGLHADRSRADTALAMASASGAPAAELLRAEAETARRAAVADARARAERLGVSLMVPLGVCVLPAFIAVGVVPLMAAVVASTLEVV